MTKVQRRKKMAEKRHFEDTLFILGIFVLLIILGQICLKYGFVIYLDWGVPMFKEVMQYTCYGFIANILAIDLYQNNIDQLVNHTVSFMVILFFTSVFLTLDNHQWKENVEWAINLKMH